MNAPTSISPATATHQWLGVIEEYRDLLDLPSDLPAITLREGGTPLVQSGWLSELTGADVWLKVEGNNPTGSFKDRGMTTALSVAVHQGARAVVCASTGNTSASMAAYAAKAGITPIVLVPDGKIAAGKMAQAIMHGAQIIKVRGNFDDCLMLARGLSQNYPVALVNSVNPDRLQGQKTAAFEIVDLLGDAPDYHLLPVGNAGNIAAYWLGWKEYAAIGRATKTPVIRGFQADGAAPLVSANRCRTPRRRLRRSGSATPPPGLSPWRLATSPAGASPPSLMNRSSRPNACSPRARVFSLSRRLPPALPDYSRSWPRGVLCRLSVGHHRHRTRAQGHSHCPGRTHRARHGHRSRRRAGGQGRRSVRLSDPVSFVRETVRVSVPATSANLGPGYDCLGLALDWRDELSARSRRWAHHHCRRRQR